MTTQEKINEIIESEFNGYRGRYYKEIGRLHNIMRSVCKPRSVIGIILNKPKVKMWDDERFLKWLEMQVLNNPRPIYKVPTYILDEHNKNKNHEQTNHP